MWAMPKDRDDLSWLSRRHRRAVHRAQRKSDRCGQVNKNHVNSSNLVSPWQLQSRTSCESSTDAVGSFRGGFRAGLFLSEQRLLGGCSCLDGRTVSLDAASSLDHLHEGARVGNVRNRSWVHAVELGCWAILLCLTGSNKRRSRLAFNGSIG